jgi:hypothetical protein
MSDYRRWLAALGLGITVLCWIAVAWIVGVWNLVVFLLAW